MTAAATYRDPDVRAANRAQVETWAASAETSLLVRTIAHPRSAWKVFVYNRHAVHIEYVWIADLAVPLSVLQQIAADELDRRLPPREK